MARRFGGRHSPGGATPQEEAIREDALAELRVDAAGAKANLLFVPPAILVFTSLGEPVGLVLGLIAAGLLFLAAWLLREGLRAHAAYDARPIARRPALPRKVLASVLTGVGVGIAAVTSTAGLLGPVLYGVAAGALHVAAFGVDPLRDKRVEGIDLHQQDRVARVTEEAEAYLAQMKDRIAALGERKLDLRVAGFQAMARRMIRTVEEDPRDLTSARKYLGVYLMGARDASVKFAEHYARTKDAEARAQYESLLTDLEHNFAARTTQMLRGDRTDMDIEIKVLRDRLAREGVGQV
ncbi:5-bromo-4-chloroindolyl phosphate hydrolysis family protein [Wenxinia marina]|uniref:5-bromo-4-chloroindolyl phosphate hydrolysis protein n=1 Tax=Wenxinia marina DSM 24838 TaxID=1123501 RepID=A0A0D0QFC2_9RHOB|nr:5-bromo-4-chloroindolyl phosphate hydrolysis family protein [Wenxinia marina]KIQ69678.1 5-bromo-4-chloroindolyl phosphate hydrolysis protein [Wenxinia marina DSM 24838]GGL60288.1 hypothetical protein GCM10011392_13490 [Wenxinia marina]